MKKKKLVCGIGINDADYKIYQREGAAGKLKITWRCPFYTKWCSMLYRCYGKEYRSRHTYIDCSVIHEWHYFMTFRAWMIQQDWEGKQLDKDILIVGNKVYSPDTCVFVDSNINSFFLECTSSRGEWPVGVSLSHGKFQARCWDVSGKERRLGVYDSPQEAHQAWLTFKLAQARILAAEQTDLRVAAALIDRYENYAKYFPQPS